MYRNLGNSKKSSFRSITYRIFKDMCTYDKEQSCSLQTFVSTENHD